MAMKSPYGISDFKKIIEQNFVDVDRRIRIPLIKNFSEQLFLLGLPRSRNSLLLNMLSNDYDIANLSKFDALFGNLTIGKKTSKIAINTSP